MAGLGRFKLTDALPDQAAPADESQFERLGEQAARAGKGKGRGIAKCRSAGAKDTASLTSGLAAEQVREARESTQAKNAEASARERMVEIGRGNQQAGRQRAK